MKKSLSRNPNMLRTMVGLGMTLIILLGYAVYSNTVDTEYYRFETTNNPTTLEIEQTDANTWLVTTNTAITWLNVSIENVDENTALTVTSSSIPFHTSELLGTDNDGRMFTCKDINDDFELIVESCIIGFTHTTMAYENDIAFKSIVSIELPLGGVGYLEATDLQDAENLAQNKVQSASKINTWTFQLTSDGEPYNASKAPTVMIVEHDLTQVNEFQLDPIVETLYGVASLIGCFTMMLVVPMIAYFSGVAKQKREDRLRSENPPPVV